jgi:hypothetical protein
MADAYHKVAGLLSKPQLKRNLDVCIPSLSEIDARIWAAIEARRQLMIDEVAAAAADLLARERRATMATLRDEIRDLKFEVAKLGSEVAELHAAATGKPTELANPLSTRRELN